LRIAAWNSRRLRERRPAGTVQRDRVPTFENMTTSEQVNLPGNYKKAVAALPAGT